MSNIGVQGVSPRPARPRSITEWLATHLPLKTSVVLIAVLVLAPLLGGALALGKWYMFGFLVVVVLTPALIRWPVISTFGLYAFLVPFDSVSTLAGAGGSSLTRLIGMLAAAVLLADGVVGRRGLVRPPLAALWWGLFVLWAALSAGWALEPSLVFQRLPTALSLFLLYLVAVSVRPSRKELLTVCMLSVMGGMIAAGIACIYTDTAETAVRGTLVVSGHKANPNALAAVLILPLSLAIGGYVGFRGLALKAVAMAALGLIGVGIYLTASRKAILAVMAMIVIFLYRCRARWQILAAVAVLLVLFAAMPEGITDRIETMFTGEDETGSGRTEIWGIGVAALERFGAWGAGLSNFTAVYNLTFPNAPRVGPRGAHNTYLATWVELGIVGLMLLLVGAGGQLLAAHRSKKRGTDGAMLAGVEAACYGMLIIAFFSDSLWTKDFWLPWILLTWATRTKPESDYHEGRLKTATGMRDLPVAAHAGSGGSGDPC